MGALPQKKLSGACCPHGRIIVMPFSFKTLMVDFSLKRALPHAAPHLFLLSSNIQTGWVPDPSLRESRSKPCKLTWTEGALPSVVSGLGSSCVTALFQKGFFKFHPSHPLSITLTLSLWENHLTAPNQFSKTSFEKENCICLVISFGNLPQTEYSHTEHHVTNQGWDFCL